MKKIIFTLGLCLSLNQISFASSDEITSLPQLCQKDIARLERLAENVSRLTATMHISAYCESGELYEESPSRYTPVSGIETLLRGMQRQQRDALVKIIQDNGELRNVKKFVRFVLSSQERQSPLSALRSFSGDDIGALWEMIQNPTIHRQEASFSKNIAAVALEFQEYCTISRSSESGFSRQVDGPTGSRILAEILRYDLTEQGLGDTYRPTDQWSIIQNILTYIEDIWLFPRAVDPDEDVFLSANKSHFLDTINAAKILFNAKDNLAIFADTPSSSDDHVIYSGKIYDVLKIFQEIYDKDNAPRSIANPEFQFVFQSLSEITNEITRKIKDGTLFSKEELESYVNFKTSSEQAPIIIQSGEIEPIINILKKYTVAQTTAQSISKKKEPERTKPALSSFSKFLAEVQNNLLRNIASRRCSEQQLAHHIWASRHLIKSAIEQGRELEPLYMSTDRSPCTTCLMTLGRLNKEMTEFLGQSFCSIIGYREQFRVESSDRRLYNMAQRFAQRNAVSIHQNSAIMSSPPRKPIHREYSTPITKSNEKNINYLKTVAGPTPERLGSVAKELFSGV